MFKVKACEKNNHRPMSDISRIALTVAPYGLKTHTSCLFGHNAEIGEKDHLWMGTSYNNIPRRCKTANNRLYFLEEKGTAQWNKIKDAIANAMHVQEKK